MSYGFLILSLSFLIQTADSENNIFGRTRNPRKLNLTAGGSSGGEGALVAFRGSLLGVGTDIAGSIRIPSLCCGVYGFKPTTGRVPYGGQASPSLAGLPCITAAAGPLATTMADLCLFFQAVLEAKPWTVDAEAVAMSFQPPASGSVVDVRSRHVLRIGVLPEDPELPLHPPVRRALDRAVAALAAAGHTIVPIPLDPQTSVVSACNLARRLFSLDPTNSSFQNIADSGEPMIATVARPPEGLGAIRQKQYGIADLSEFNVQRALFRSAWRAVFNDGQLDVVIGPGAQHTAPKHDTYGMPGYTVLWNLLDVSIMEKKGGEVNKNTQANTSVPTNHTMAAAETVPCLHSSVRHGVQRTRPNRVGRTDGGQPAL